MVDYICQPLFEEIFGEGRRFFPRPVADGAAPPRRPFAVRSAVSLVSAAQPVPPEAIEPPGPAATPRFTGVYTHEDRWGDLKGPQDGAALHRSRYSSRHRPLS